MVSCFGNNFMREFQVSNCRTRMYHKINKSKTSIEISLALHYIDISTAGYLILSFLQMNAAVVLFVVDHFVESFYLPFLLHSMLFSHWSC